MNKTNKKGFTLAELLIVVAIIAVLVAIAIPVFTAQLEKSREAVDAANIRAKYAEMMSDAVTGGYNNTADHYYVDLQQKTEDWQTTELKAGLEKIMTFDGTTKVGENKKAVLTYDSTLEGKAAVKITIK